MSRMNETYQAELSTAQLSWLPPHLHICLLPPNFYGLGIDQAIGEWSPNNNEASCEANIEEGILSVHHFLSLLLPMPKGQTRKSWIICWCWDSWNPIDQAVVPGWIWGQLEASVCIALRRRCLNLGYFQHWRQEIPKNQNASDSSCC